MFSFITKKLPYNLEVYNFFATFAPSLADKVFYVFMKTSELLESLRDAGCVLARNGKRHDKWTNPRTGASEWVPRHAGEVPTGTAQKILKKLVGE
jgi:predicted RNA binding protein YcfA (HicA-like mRNA interferase family)